MSWLFSQALGEAFSAANCSDGKPFVQLNVMPTQHKFWRNDKTMEFSNLSRFGLTCAVLTESRGAELLTWYLAASPARTFQWPVKAQELQVQGQGYGKSSPGLLARYDHNTHSLKTVQCSLVEDLTECSVTLPRWGSMRSGALYLRQIAALPISGSVFGFSLPTPVSSDATSGAVIGKNDKFYTTSTGMPRKVNQNGKDGSVGLGRLVQMWPTPQASDNRDRGNTSSGAVMRRIEKGKQISLSQSVDASSGALNPPWVEWLMGWPIGWTDLKPLETDKYPCALQQHSESLLNEVAK